MGRDGAAVQPAGEADMRSLAVMLQYGACVVSNAGTILLDCTRQRPAGSLRPLRRGCSARGDLGREERARRALPRADVVDGLLPGFDLRRRDRGHRTCSRSARRALGRAPARRTRGGRGARRSRRRACRRRDRAAGRGGVSGAANLGHRQWCRARGAGRGSRPAARRARGDAGLRRAGRGDGGCRARCEGGGRRHRRHPAGRVAGGREPVDRPRGRDGHRTRAEPRRGRVG